MSNVREQIKQKFMDGKHEDIGDEWFMMSLQVFEHELDDTTKEKLNLRLDQLLMKRKSSEEPQV